MRPTEEIAGRAKPAAEMDKTSESGIDEVPTPREVGLAISPILRSRTLHFVFGCIALTALPRLMFADDPEVIVAQARNGYTRTKRRDGTYVPEYVTLVKGTEWGGDVADPSLDNMTFEAIAKPITQALAAQNYLPSQDRTAIKHLIVVYWGLTRAPRNGSPSIQIPGQDVIEGAEPSFFDRMTPYFVDHVPIAPDSDRSAMGNTDTQNKTIMADSAKLLGYNSSNHPDLLGPRYFVALLAFDFQRKLARGENRLLWQTRFSIDARGQAFDRALPEMVAQAASYFGSNNSGANVKPVPDGRVRIGETTTLGFVDPAAPHPAPPPVALSPDGRHVALWRPRERHFELAIVPVNPEQRSVIAEDSEQSAPWPLQWIDPQHVVFSPKEKTDFVVDLRGRIKKADTALLARSGIDGVSAEAESKFEGLRAVFVDKLPDRTLALLGADSLMERFLLRATAPSGARRLYVYDQPTDLLFEVSRE